MKLGFTTFLRVYDPLLDLKGIGAPTFVLSVPFNLRETPKQKHLQETLENKNLQNCETFLFQVAS